MIIEFNYSLISDLMYHILAHMKVDNVSNLYSQAYIDNINKIKNARYDSITKIVSHLSNYYNRNFERLAVINFIPFAHSSVQDLIEANENYCVFTETDKKEFISPLNQLLKSGFEFYENYWKKLFDATSIRRKAFEAWLKNEMSKYETLFLYFNKSAVVSMSYSLTSNGRGYGSTSSFNAVVPFAFYESENKNTFYQILHEYTHQFTDDLLGKNLRMDDGTHDTSEKVAILFDYYFIKKLYKEDINSYLEWIGSLSKIDNCDEKLFLSVFKINNDVHERLLEMVDMITSK